MADSPVRPAGASRIWAGGISIAVMVTLVSLMARADAVSRTQHDPTVWWYVTRASGLLALALLSASVLGGLLVSTRLARSGSRDWTQGLHEFVGALAVMFTTIHLVSVSETTELRVGVRQLLVPFTRLVNPVAQGLGVLAFYLLVAVVLTSWARAALPWRWWRRVHMLAFPLWVLAGAHTVLAGSDVSRPVSQWAGLAVGLGILFLAVLRLLTVRPPVPTTNPPVIEPVSPELPAAAGPQLGPPAAELAGTQLLIGQTTWEADNVLSLRLRAPDGAPLPSWEPGAHLEVVLASGRRRQYSLCGDPADTRSYRIAVLRVSPGRGGSVEVHDSARVGRLVTVHGPRNHFPLVANAAYLFIAGGIGITAIVAMVARVTATGGQWRLVYVGRRRSSMAFLDEVHALDPDRVDVMPADERGRPDLDTIITGASPGTAVYCCGPDRLLKAVRQLVATRPDLSLHSERFTHTTTFTAASSDSAFTVELRRSGRTVDVLADRTVLQAVREILPTVRAGCEQGICGACRTTVLAGRPDHRDDLLSSAERAAGVMLICVSRARTERLTLDL